MIAWRSLSSINLHQKTADCTLASVIQCVYKPWRQLPLWTTCGVTSKVSTERAGSSKVKSTRTARISIIPGSIFEQASLCGKMPLICQQGQVPRLSSTTRGELAFRNITALEKEAAEVWASLKTEGESANAWWGARCVQRPQISRPMGRPNGTLR